MKLKKAHVQNYRSIVDSGPIEVEDGVTVIIGKNEQGKTNLLKAIRSFNPEQKFTPGDLPNHLRPGLEERPAGEIAIVTLWFAIEPQDKEKIGGVLQNIETLAELKCTKNYDNSYQFWAVKSDGTTAVIKFAPPDLSSKALEIKKIISELKAKLSAHGVRVPEFAANNDKIEQITSALVGANLGDPIEADNSIKTFAITLKGLTAQDQPILDDITVAINSVEAVRASIRQIHQQDSAVSLKQHLPVFILHSTTEDHIPNEVNVADFLKDPDIASRGMSNLCRAAGLSVQKIRELAATSDVQHRQTYEDHYKGTISGGLNEFWSQAEYEVHFRIEKEKLSVAISDGKYTPRIAPSDRSDGFQWYLSFYATLLNDVGSARRTVLLLDNPGLELHLDGQRDIKRFLEEKVCLTSQLLYVTHSPAMIDPFNLGQVRTVELRGNQDGTKVSNFVNKEGADTDLLEPVRSAIGMSLVTSLLLNEWNVLVEGASDKPIIEGIFFSHYKDDRKKILVNGSLSESKDAFLAKFYHRTQLPYVVVLDADSGGRELAAELKRLGIPEERIVSLKDVFPNRGGEFATEDILSAAFYHQAVTLTYPNKPVDQPAEGDQKRANAYEAAFKGTHNFGFSKKRVAGVVRKLLQEHKEDTETQNNLGFLSTAIIEKLKAQRPQHEQRPAIGPGPRP